MKRGSFLNWVLFIAYILVAKNTSAQRNSLFLTGAAGPNFILTDHSTKTNIGYSYSAGAEMEFKKYRNQFYFNPKVLLISNTFTTKLETDVTSKTTQGGVLFGFGVGFDKNKLGSLKTSIFFEPLLWHTHAVETRKASSPFVGFGVGDQDKNYTPFHYQAGFTIGFSSAIAKKIHLDLHCLQYLIPIVKETYYLDKYPDIKLLTRESYATVFTFGLKYKLSKQK